MSALDVSVEQLPNVPAPDLSPPNVSAPDVSVQTRSPLDMCALDVSVEQLPDQLLCMNRQWGGDHSA